MDAGPSVSADCPCTDCCLTESGTFEAAAATPCIDLISFDTELSNLAEQGAPVRFVSAAERGPLDTPSCSLPLLL